MEHTLSAVFQRHRERKARSRGYRTVWWLVEVAAASYVGFLILVVALQSRMIYAPSRDVYATPADMGLAFEEVNLPCPSGGAINGWFVPREDARATLLFCHGNAGNIADRMDSIRIFHDLGLNVFIFDYRGYGKSAGRATEAHTYEDAQTAWRHLTETSGGARGIAPSDIVVFGRSLGGPIAAHLAGRTSPHALILESTMKSAPDVAAAAFPWLPARHLCIYRYRTLEYVSAVKCPLLVVHSPQDDLIPCSQGQALFEAAGEPKAFLEISGDHNDGFVMSGNVYIEGLDAFLTRYVSPRTPRRMPG